MISPALRQAATESQWHISSLPPIFLLPLRARLSTSSSFTNPSQLLVPSQPPKRSHSSDTTNVPLQTPSFVPWSTARSQPLLLKPQDQHQTPTSTKASIFPPTVRDLSPLLQVQPSHYITAHIHARPYLLTEGDTLRLPFHMPKVKPGDILRLDRASSIGSRDYTMRGAPYLDERLFECRATVVGVEAEPMRYIEKTKRRNRKVKTVKSKHRFTVLKIKELKLKSLKDVEEGSAQDIFSTFAADAGKAA
ncbi:hypothetical protein MMC13_007930 [Lambiella insularis]|nr:hypothetical protein [Lambiella insularis]